MTASTSTPTLSELEDRIREQYRIRYRKFSNKLLAITMLTVGASLATVGLNDSNPYQELPQVKAYMNVQQQLSQVYRSQQNLLSVGTLSNIVVDPAMQAHYTSLVTSVDALKQPLQQEALQLEQHPDVLNYHAQKETNFLTKKIALGAALGVTALALLVILIGNSRHRQERRAELEALYRVHLPSYLQRQE